MIITYLTLILRETIDLSLQILNLVLLFLIDGYLLCYVVLGLFLLGVHGLDLALKALFVFLALGQLDLNIPQTLLQFLDLSHGDAQLLDRLRLADVVRGLHSRDSWRELRRRLLN